MALIACSIITILLFNVVVLVPIANIYSIVIKDCMFSAYFCRNLPDLGTKKTLFGDPDQRYAIAYLRTCSRRACQFLRLKNLFVRFHDFSMTFCSNLKIPWLFHDRPFVVKIPWPFQKFQKISENPWLFHDRGNPAWGGLVTFLALGRDRGDRGI